MYIRVDERGNLAVHEAQNLSVLKLVTSLTHAQLLDAFAAPAAPGSPADSEHVWISRDWLFAQGPGAKSWALEFEKMMDYARTKGWLHPTLPKVRVHVEYNPKR